MAEEGKTKYRYWEEKLAAAEENPMSKKGSMFLVQKTMPSISSAVQGDSERLVVVRIDHHTIAGNEPVHESLAVEGGSIDFVLAGEEHLFA